MSKKHKRKSYLKKDRTWGRNKKLHLLRRARERYGLELSAFDYDDMVKQIKEGRAEKVSKSVYGVICQEKKVYIATSLYAGEIQIKTMLPQDCKKRGTMNNCCKKILTALKNTIEVYEKKLSLIKKVVQEIENGSCEGKFCIDRMSTLLKKLEERESNE